MAMRLCNDRAEPLGAGQRICPACDHEQPGEGARRPGQICLGIAQLVMVIDAILCVVRRPFAIFGLLVGTTSAWAAVIGLPVGLCLSVAAAATFARVQQI
ncbi:MAG: hypothetical protein GVY24_04830 [Planctomycetes bacterium]|jgi:hypothetical protein|nr:hypothetical protein [Planctomycetota bacterium]